MNTTVETIDFEVIQNDGNRCGCCHRPIDKGDGVSFGRPHFVVPAINVCRRCVNIAQTVLGPLPTTTRMGRG